MQCNICWGIIPQQNYTPTKLTRGKVPRTIGKVTKNGDCSITTFRVRRSQSALGVQKYPVRRSKVKENKTEDKRNEVEQENGSLCRGVMDLR